MIAEDEWEEDLKEETLTAALHAQFDSAPWYMSSLCVHLVLFTLMLIFTPAPQLEHTERFKIENIAFTPEKEIETPPPPQPVDDKPEPKIDELVEVTVSATIEVDPTIETFEDEDVSEDDSNEDPAEFAGDLNDDAPALMALGVGGGPGGGGGGKGDGFGKRRNRKSVISSTGIDAGPVLQRTDWALKWLAYHQDTDGHWDNVGYEGKNNGKPLEAGQYDVPVTSLALLAFLTAGNSADYGKYKKQVAAAQEWLISRQQGNGQIGRNYKYEAAFALMAMVEAYGMADEKKSNRKALRSIAQRAVDHAVASQNTTGAWDYAPNSTRSDTSPTGWWMMGLKAAKVGGLNVPNSTFDKARTWFERACTEDGRVWYAEENGKMSNNGSGIMAAAGLTCRLFLGYPKTDTKIVAIAQKLLSGDFHNAPLPTFQKSPDHTCFYGWYYQSLAFFQMGSRSMYWKAYYPLMKAELFTTQRMDGTVSQHKGSWNPPDVAKIGTAPWHGADNWGRVGQTAVGALMLEVFYHYGEDAAVEG